MSPTASLPTILFSIEISARELDSKLAMASALAARGCRSIVGHKEAITAIALASERAVWQGKGLFSDKSTDEHLADRLIERSTATMFHQDEGAMHPVNAWTENVLQKHYVEHIRRRDITRVCMWGHKQKDVFAARAPETEDRLTVTGSPRFDLCLPSFAWMTAEQTEAIRAEHAPYILVCTRFTAIAHGEGMHDPFRRKLNPKIWPGFDMNEVVNLWFSKWHGDVTDFAEMVMLIKELAVGFPDRTILLRPHPSESLAFYAQAFSSFKNVVVTREGSVLPWIRAADLVVHSNCTTGIEAVLAGRPTLNLLPEGPARNQTDVAVACEAGLTATSVADAVDKAGQLLSGSVAPHAWSPNAQSMLNNLEAEAIPLMAEETMRVLERKRITSSKVSFPRPTLRSVVRRVVKGPDTTAYIRSKRGPLDPKHVERLIYGCRATGVGGGRVSHITPQYAVIDPA